VTLPAAYKRIAVKAAEVMGLEVSGVDLLEGKAGPRILEINSSPGIEGIERATGVDVAGAIVAHIEKFARKNKRRRMGKATVAQIIEADG
jgi:ribosomal protein S6--L-glutamate ligase